MQSMHIKMFMIACLTASVAADGAGDAASNMDRHPRKRQIYREQVLPHAGGRIPDTAFETDRLFLNQLQKDGFAVPDGIIPEQRNPQVYPFYNRPSRKVYRIALSSDGRFTPQEGRYHYQELPSIETTYLYPQIHGQQVTLTPPGVALPIYRPFRIHNPLLNQIKLQPKDKTQFQNVLPLTKSSTGPSKAKSYQNFNLLNTPLTHHYTGKSSVNSLRNGNGKSYYPNYSTTTQSHLFNDFDDFYDHFDVYDDDLQKSNTFPAATTSPIGHSHYVSY